MALHNVEVPCYTFQGEDPDHSLIVDEWNKRLQLTVRDHVTDTEIQVEVYFDDLERAWVAVKP